MRTQNDLQFIILDRKLTWDPYFKDKRMQLNSEPHLLRPLVSSNIDVHKKLLIYLRTIWIYGIFGAQAKTETITQFKFSNQFVQQKTFGMLQTNPSMATYKKYIQETAIILYSMFHNKPQANNNCLISQLASKTLPDHPVKRQNKII